VTDRARLIREVASLVPVSTGDACVRVGVDGVDGAGKTTFADELAAALEAMGRCVVRVSADDFHQVRALRYRRGRNSPEGFWLDSYDYVRLRRDVLDPLGPGGSREFRPAAHDLASDRVLEPPLRRAEPGCVLVLDGLFLHRDELADAWDFSVFLDVPFAVTAARMADRDGSHPDPEHPSMQRYVQGQRLYFDACRPWQRAAVAVDNADPHHPRLIRRRTAPSGV